MGKQIFLYMHTLTIVLLSFSLSAQTKEIKSVEIFAIPLDVSSARVITLNDLSDTSNFVMKSSDPYFLNALTSFSSELNEKKAIKPKKVALRDYRILVSILYKDGSNGYLGASTIPYVNYNGNVYKDKVYQFYRLLSIYTDIKTIKRFLEDNN